MFLSATILKIHLITHYCKSYIYNTSTLKNDNFCFAFGSCCAAACSSPVSAPASLLCPRLSISYHNSHKFSCTENKDDDDGGGVGGLSAAVEDDDATLGLYFGGQFKFIPQCPVVHPGRGRPRRRDRAVPRAPRARSRSLTPRCGCTTSLAHLTTRGRADQSCRSCRKISWDDINDTLTKHVFR